MKENPYFSIEKSVYFTDGVEEIIVQKFDRNDTAMKVSELLNIAYCQAFQDGLNAVLNEKYKELIDHVTMLTIENLRLKEK